MNNEWKLVPVEPTEEMAVAALKAMNAPAGNVFLALKDGIAAAPQPPALGGELEDLQPDAIHQLAFEVGQPADNGDGYLFSAEEFDLFAQELIDRAYVAPLLAEAAGYKDLAQRTANQNKIWLKERNEFMAERDTLKARCEELERERNIFKSQTEAYDYGLRSIASAKKCTPADLKMMAKVTLNKWAEVRLAPTQAAPGAKDGAQ